MKSLGRLDFIVRQRHKTLLKIFYLEGLDLWFKKTSVPVPISKAQALHLITVWQANHEKANARISGGLIPYLESDAYKTQTQMVQRLENDKRITISTV
jgi:hypothetical protein